MQKLLIGFACVVFASQACLADNGVRFNLARPNTSAEQFRQDRDDCSAKTAEEVSRPAATPDNKASTTAQPTTYYRANVPAFLQCMKAKGYQESAAGPRPELIILKLSRPNTSYYTFLDERTVCLKATSRTQFAIHYGQDGEWTTYHLGAFYDCMKAKGYVRDPKGYRALRYRVWPNGIVRMETLDG